MKLDASKLTDGELADLIHELSDELEERLRKIKTGDWLRDQMAQARLEGRSWSSQQQRNRKI